MKKLLSIIFALAFLAACGNRQSPPDSSSLETTISETEYKQTLGKAVCEAVHALNAKGILNDEEKFAKEFDGEIQKSIRAMGYEIKNWLNAKTKYFPNEEDHTKLVKLHFTWCLVSGLTQN